MIYYFPSALQWLTPANDKCRLCTCTNGTRTCMDCEPIVKIDVRTEKTIDREQSTSIGEMRLSPSMIKATPCILQTSINSHRLIFPGQHTWFEERCYFCSSRGDKLIRC